jgi:hypothetical protein
MRLAIAARKRLREGTRIDTLPLRDRLIVYAAYPFKTIRYFHARWRKWATVPGDTWLDFQRDTYYVVTSIKHDHIDVEVYSGQVWKTPSLRAQAETAPRVRIDSLLSRRFRSGMVVDVASVPKADMDSWWPA